MSVEPLAFDRHRRLRGSSELRRLVRETRLTPAMTLLPVFIDGHLTTPEPIPSLPGHSRWPAAGLGPLVERAVAAGIGGLLLFGLPTHKDEHGRTAADSDGPVPLALRSIRAMAPPLVLVADVCLCEYTTHGHCGALRPDGTIDNDATLPLLAAAAVTYADAGADVLAPSDMMDGRIATIRRVLDDADYIEQAILAYAAKYRSALYGPFRDAADCAPQYGDRSSYQIDPANRREAARELHSDLAEGADLLMVKPAGPYLDVIADARRRFDVPIAAYQVSGEYAALHAAADRGWLELRGAAVESLTGIARAGADVIVTYFALELAEWLRDES